MGDHAAADDRRTLSVLRGRGKTSSCAFQHSRPKSTEEAGREIAELAATTSAAKVETEAEKIKGAVRTDFVLSAEIIAITLRRRGRQSRS